MPSPSDAVRPAPGPPTALPATRPSRHQPRLQARQKTEVVVAATVAAILLLLLAFVLWPVLRVLATSLAGPAGLTLANYAEVFTSWRPPPRPGHHPLGSPGPTGLHGPPPPVLASYSD